MNPKIDKLARDIEKTEKKIADLQKKLELFKEEKTRLENEDYDAVKLAATCGIPGPEKGLPGGVANTASY